MKTLKIIAPAALALSLAAPITLTQTTPSQAQDHCFGKVTHWGKTAWNIRKARRNARKGMRWKIRNRMGDTVRIVGGIRINQCKIRSSGRWQCQARVIRDYCI